MTLTLTVTDDKKRKGPRKDAEARANIFSRLTFHWVADLMAYGWNHDMYYDDLWDVPKHETCEDLYQKHMMDYERELIVAVKAKKTAKEIPSHLKPLAKLFFPPFAVVAVIRLIAMACQLGATQVIDNFISYLSDKSIPEWYGQCIALAIFFMATADNVLASQYFHVTVRLARRGFALENRLIYRKSLRLSAKGRSQFMTGAIVNLLAVDLHRIVGAVDLFQILLMAPPKIIISMILLWNQIGIAALAGVVAIMLLIPLNGFFTSFVQKFDRKFLAQKDKRIKIMSEILTGIKIIKLYSWEESFKKIVSAIRRAEMTILVQQSFFLAGIVFAMTSATVLVSMVSFGAFVLINPDVALDANKAFVSLALFNIIRQPLTNLPDCVTYISSMRVSLQRINNFLAADEVDEDAIDGEDKDSNVAISLNNGTFSWDEDQTIPTLRDISLSVPKGSLIAIVGKVGAGKSSLMSAMLGEMKKISGTITTSGRIGYVPQQAWIQNSTVRDNVTLCRPYSQELYGTVVDASCLGPDLAFMPAGDETEIGEKGINLSGGQKQRISLARAVYADADIYLLDDPLSAVDAHVGTALFERVLGPSGLLKDKTRLLCTHKISILPRFDLIVALKDGQISEMGTFDELMSHNGAFAEFIAEYETSEKEEEEKAEGQEDESSETAEEDKDKATEKPKSGQLIKNEWDKRGSISWQVYKDYLKAFGIWRSALVVGLYVSIAGITVGNNIWLSAWTDDARLVALPSNDSSLMNSTSNDSALIDTTSNNLTSLDRIDPTWKPMDPRIRIGVYSAFGIAEGIGNFCVAVLLFTTCLKTSRILHSKMLNRILSAPMEFFDTTPLGRIINRFSSEIDTVDSTLPSNMRMFLMHGFRVLCFFILISLQSAYLLVVMLTILGVYLVMQRFYMATSRQVRRIESSKRSPIYSNFSETISGASTIRAMGLEVEFNKKFDHIVDCNNNASYTNSMLQRWVGVNLNFLGNLAVYLSLITASLMRDSEDGEGLAALSITSALALSNALTPFNMSMGRAELSMVAVERCLEYANTVPQEAPHEIEETKPRGKWPEKGAVTFDKYSTRYRKDLPLVLQDILLDILPGERIGIVGRTGAGKSSITVALFRLIEPTAGTICLDSVDVLPVGLNALRSNITIIPQDPVLFTGSLRMNLDPFGHNSDDALWRSLELAHLKDFALTLAGGLDYEITEGGSNLSMGQKQLVCLARALLRRSKILVLDEATASVDLETDNLIQATVRKEFSDCTILTIAHRLSTIMDYDRILVLEAGQVKEFDSPDALIKDQTSLFYALAKESNLV